MVERLAALRGTVVRDDERYRILDYVAGSVTLSVTELRPGQSTRGHSHPWPEAYLVESGEGVLEEVPPEGETPIWTEIRQGAMALIKAGYFHRVHTTGGIRFWCLFSGRRTG